MKGKTTSRLIKKVKKERIHKKLKRTTCKKHIKHKTPNMESKNELQKGCR